MPESWTNWSGAVSCEPHAIQSPTDEAELARIIVDAAEKGHTVRVAGSGHSFMPLCATDGVLLSLDELRGSVSIDPGAREVTLRAGSKLYDIGEPLRRAGLAMEKDGLFHMASNTKAVVATAVIMLDEQDKLDMNDFVRKHIPSFDNHRSGGIEIRHLLSHTSGLPTVCINRAPVPEW